MSSIVLRSPGSAPAKVQAGYNSPSIPWLVGTWHVTHSTLPLWKDKCNVKITYSALPPAAEALTLMTTDRLDDVVSYQRVGSDKIQTIHGVDELAAHGESRDSWDWHGKGWLAWFGTLAHSHWEILGCGEETGTRNTWLVTMFAKTLFTPAGIDIYSRGAEGLREETVEAIKRALLEVEDADVKRMATHIFAISME